MTPLEINKKIHSLKLDEKIKNTPQKFIEENRDYVNFLLEQRDYFLFIPEKNWAENISDAWELFEEMPKSYFLGKSVTHQYGFEIWKINDDGKGLTQLLDPVAETAPMAICLAWIAWKEAK